MNVLVCGESPFSNGLKVFDTLDRIAAHVGISRVLYSEGGGAGELACAWADRRNVQLKNLDLRDSGPLFPKKRKPCSDRPDLVVAFAGGRRTDDIVRRAKEDGLVVIEVDAEPSSLSSTAKHAN